MMTTSVRPKVAAKMLSLAQIGYAEWFFGNLYEAVVKVPGLLAQGQLTSTLGAGSPVRYYLPGAVISCGATSAAVVSVWKLRTERRAFVAMVLALLAGGVATAHLVRTVNLKLFMRGNSIPQPERDRMLGMWYRVNAIRLGTTACAWSLAAWINYKLRSENRNSKDRS